VAIVRQQEQVAYFASGWPIFVHAEDDGVGQRIVAAPRMELGLAQQDELRAALGVHRSTLYRQHRKLSREGVLGVVDAKRGPHGPHRFTADKRRRVVELLGEGRSMREAARQVGVSEGVIRRARRRGELPVTEAEPARPREGPQARSQRDAQAAGAVAVKRHEERPLARRGQLTEAARRSETIGWTKGFGFGYRRLDEQVQAAVATREALVETAEHAERVSGAAVRRR